MDQLILSSILEKNKISNNGSYLFFLEITIPKPEIVIRLVNNNRDITWNGYTWNAYPFNIGEMKEDGGGELPRVPLTIAQHYLIAQYLEESDGAQGATIDLNVVRVEGDRFDLLGVLTFGVRSVKPNDDNISIDLGADVLFSVRYPFRSYGKEHCQAYRYGDVECGVSDAVKAQYPTCARTVADCRLRSPGRLQGFPGMTGGGGLYVN